MAQESGEVPPFQEADSWQGARPGMVFKVGHLGLGYYLDPVQAKSMLLDEVVPKLPENWRNAAFREVRLCVDEKLGCGLSMEPCEFGFSVDEVEEKPGQEVEVGEVIVAIEGRILAGLSGPQMQASFHKRRLQGSRLHVANLAQVQALSTRDPAIVEMWDNAKRHHYYFHKKTGRSAWTVEELQGDSAAASSGSDGKTEEATQAAPIDLSHFLTHGFAKQKEPPKKKKKVEQKEKTGTEKLQDESDLAREERSRWKNWNEGGSGGYTDAFFARYSHCQSAPDKPKQTDKRLKGSVGPGQGMEYMAKWTGSKNSFN